MQFLPVALLASAAALVGAAPQTRQNCPESTQFGVLTISPTNVTAGQILTITADFTCAISAFNYDPEFTDYYIVVPSNNNSSNVNELPILLTRQNGSGNDTDVTAVVVPEANYLSNVSYAVLLANTFATTGPTGEPYSAVGTVQTPITINGY